MESLIQLEPSRRGSCPGTTTGAGEAVGGGPEPSADLLRQLDDDRFGAADVAEPMAVSVALRSQRPYDRRMRAELRALDTADVDGGDLRAFRAEDGEHFTAVTASIGPENGRGE